MATLNKIGGSKVLKIFKSKGLYFEFLKDVLLAQPSLVDFSPILYMQKMQEGHN
jgi:hypothetical protein